MRQAKSKQMLRVTFRRLGMIVLSVLCVLSLVGFMFAHWTERQLLNTDNWVTMVAPLPKNDQVATALSDYSVTQLFGRLNLQQRISDALPPRAAFLAGPLSDQLDTRTKQLAKQAVKSDNFQQVWVAANRSAHQALIQKARGESHASPKAGTNFALNLKGFKNTILQRFGQNSGQIFNGRPSGNNISLDIGLKAKFSVFKKFVNVTDFLDSTLWLVSIACLLGALILTIRRRRLIMILSGTFAFIALLQLIGVRSLRPAILNAVQNASYRPAAGVIYDDLLAAFRHASTVLLAASLLIFIAAFLWSKPVIGHSQQATKALSAIKRNKVMKSVKNLRRQAGRYKLQLMGLAAFLVLVYMAFISPQFGWQGLVRAALVIAILCESISLFSAQTISTGRRKPI